jgi:arsenate reductase
MFATLKNTCDELVTQFDTISQERKEILQKIASYVQQKVNANENISLMFVCTHNSRRSHYGQLWGALAASYYQVPNVFTYSGGTEETAFHPNAIQALQTLGFQIETKDSTSNPRYEVRFGENTDIHVCFSKKYNHETNPSVAFCAIMTCGDAEQNCPFIPGVELRIATTYDDPKTFDNTPLQAEKYKERALQIGKEVLYVFSLILH